MFRLPWSVGMDWIGRERANIDIGPPVGRPLQYEDKVKAGGYGDGEKIQIWICIQTSEPLCLNIRHS